MTFDGYAELTADELAAYDTRTYGASKIAKGLYLQLADDGKQWFLILQAYDGAHFGLDSESFPESFPYWTFAATTRQDLERIGRESPTAEDFEYAVRQSALEDSWFRTKREATAAALRFASRPTPAPKPQDPEKVARVQAIREQGLGIGAVLATRPEDEE